MKKVVITYGTFDLFHIGHVNLLKRARQLGDELIVGCSTDTFNETKGKEAIFSYEERTKILQSCRYVDKVIPEENWDQKRADIQHYKAHIFVMGDDWYGKFDHLADVAEIQYLTRTPHISSSKIKQYM